MDAADSETQTAADAGIVGGYKAVNPDWGLDGRHRDTSSLDVARYWSDAYRQLLEFDTAALNYMREQIEDLPIEVRREVEVTNIPIMDGQIERVRARLAFWESKERELSQMAR